ncbi:PREDICTED: uncharacterized protein LOC108554119 [Eufriesea mexicana]|uniref:uncharacterized protein LOC108554119 n=1 Tax=Eufriesea mexicana TaxID=516756 RepID=UPI00083C5B90|nr:PREDICTED: uncharacterized protein LOC108554119 [Eufriesea mexicana]
MVREVRGDPWWRWRRPMKIQGRECTGNVHGESRSRVYASIVRDVLDLTSFQRKQSTTVLDCETTKMDWENRTVSLLLCLSILLATIHNGNAERKIVCYYTSWSIYRPGTAKFSPQNINPYLCTHLIYAFGGFTKDNALKPFDKYQDIEKGGYAKFNGLKTYNKNLKTLLAIGGWNEGSSRFSPMFADPDRRREFVKNTIKFLRKNHFDGLDLDWEYPASREGGKPRDKDNYASLVQELREEFERESSKTGRPRLLVSLAMPAGIEHIEKGYDIPRLNEYLDFINLLSYDYHSSYDPAVNHHAPLYPLEEDNEYSYDTELTIDYTVNYLLKNGATPEKLVLGIPTYGRTYTLFNQDATDLGSPADGPGTKGDATGEKGYLAYYEICENLEQSDDWEVVQPNPKAMGPYAYKGDQWVGYDDVEMVRLKAKYANEKKLGGIMFWTIDNDDFRGKCHGRPYPLIETAKETLLTDSSTNAVQKSKATDSRKKIRVHGAQSNTVARRTGSNVRRSTTTAAPVSKNRISSSRPKYRTISRSRASEEDEEDEQIDRQFYDSSSNEEENSERGNVVRSINENERTRNRNKSRPKGRSSSNRNRRKPIRRKEQTNDDSKEESLSNRLTTPEPPTTPDPGTDFKCEDEGFFPHPRDCKKYFWCLESGPGGLGVVAHQFTCPSGLVFNKAADSCDYPRNVACPKSKPSQSTVSTTRAPITAATSRTTYLYSTTRRSTSEKLNTEEDYEYYDEDDEEDEEEEKEEKEKPKVTSTPKTLLYKTITRNKSSTTTTTEAPSTTSKTDKHVAQKEIDIADEEDPKVIKELIMLIKKAGGIEQLEKQLLLQNKSPNNTASSGSENATPATISRTLYERVLNRQAGKIANRQRTPTNANGPGKAQFEGLDEVPEVKGLRRSQKPQYVTIERSKPSTKEPPTEDEDVDEEDVDEDNTDVASSEEQTISNPFLTSSTQRATPNYINIRRPRPSTSRNENDAKEKNKDEEEEGPIRRRRPGVSSNSENTKDQESRSATNEENSQTTKSRYVSVQRFRSTTPQSTEAVSEVASTSQSPITESVVSSEPPKIDQQVDTTTTTAVINIQPSIGLSSTPNDILIDPETEKPISTTTPEASSTTESVRLVEDSATEILLTTAPASSSTLSSPNTRISTATVSQPRPFGFNRRNRPSTEPTTTPLPSSNDQTRFKVASSEVNRLPTLKELIGYQTNNYTSSPSPIFLSLFPLKTKNKEVLSREKDANSILEETTVREDIISNDTESKSWMTNKHDKKEERSNTVQNDLDLSIDDIDAYYVDDNSAVDDDDTSLTNKKRIDREGPLTTTLKPTTMRGIPLVNLLKSKVPRGFYVTRSETEHPISEKLEDEALTTEFTTPLIERNYNVPDKIERPDMDRKMDSDLQDDDEENSKSSTEVTLNSYLSKNNNGDVVRIKDEVDSATSLMDQEHTEKYIPTTPDVSSIVDFTEIENLEKDITSSASSAITIPIHPTPITSTPSSPTEPEPSIVSKSIDTMTETSLTNNNNNTNDNSIVTDETTSISVTEVQSNVVSRTSVSEPVTEAELYSENRTYAADLENGYSTNGKIGKTYTDEDGKNSTRNNEDSKLTSSLTTTTFSSTSVAELVEAPTTRTERTLNKSNLRRQKTRFNPSYEFGRKSGNRHYVSPAAKEGQEDSIEEVRTQYPRRRIINYRKSQRRRVVTTRTTNNSLVYETTTRYVKKTKANNRVRNLNDRERSYKEETSVGKKLMPKTYQTGNKAVFKEEHLRIEENIDRFEPEVNSSKNTVTTRTPGNLPSTRLRKPSTFNSTSLQSKTANTFANHRKTHLTDGKFQTHVNETLDAMDERTETPKPEKDIDQSSRAQEIAVTLADPPSPQSSATGRPLLRNALRRKISTTVAPRTDATTSRATLRFTPTHRGRQKAKTKDKTQQNVTTRPIRPPVIDYDYYEDEEEPVIGKSNFNGKLFLTNKGTIRCLDQGNFPHPDSCKKFITCAKMVNGLVIGAEYTCPDKLSFDPVGGICNWSAGLGCKE